MSRLSNYTLLELIAGFLSHCYGFGDYGQCKKQDVTAKLIQHLENDWPNVRAFAHENRIWTNIVACIAESQELLAACSNETSREIVILYLQQQAQAEKDKKQLQEIDQCCAEINNPLVLMKGASRLYDNLYPSPAHRYMADIDIYFEDPECITALASACLPQGK